MRKTWYQPSTNMMRALVITVMLTCCGQCIAGSYTGATPEFLDQEQARLNKLNRRIDSVSTHHGKLRLIRDEYFNGKSGVVSKTTSWLEKAELWKTDLNNTIQSFHNLDKMLHDSATRTEVQSQLNKLNTTFSKLVKEAHSLQQYINWVNKELDSVRDFPDVYLPKHKELLKAIREHKAVLSNSLNKIESTIDIAFVNDMQFAHQKLTEVSQLLLDQARIKNPELQKTIDNIELIIISETFITPRTKEMIDFDNKIYSLLRNKQVFNAEKMLEKMTARSQESIAELKQISIDETARNEAIKEISYRVSNSTRKVNSSLSRYARRHVEYRLSKVKRLAPYCTNPESFGRDIYNCTLLRHITKLDKTQLRGMNVEMLRLVDENINNIYAGPLGDIE